MPRRLEMYANNFSTLPRQHCRSNIFELENDSNEIKHHRILIFNDQYFTETVPISVNTGILRSGLSIKRHSYSQKTDAWPER